MGIDFNFIKDVFSKGINVLKTGWGVFKSEIDLAKYLFTYGKHLFNMIKTLASESNNEEQ